MAKVMYDKNGVLGVVSKSSFLPKEQNRRISRGYCRVIGPKHILGRGPSLRTPSSPRTGNCGYEGQC